MPEESEASLPLGAKDPDEDPENHEDKDPDEPEAPEDLAFRDQSGFLEGFEFKGLGLRVWVTK